MDLLDTSGLVFFFQLFCVYFGGRERKRKRRVAWSKCYGHGSCHDQIKISARPRLKWIQRYLSHPVYPISPFGKPTYSLATNHQCLLSDMA